MKIYLIRHGQTDWNLQGRIQGSHDIPLNGTGLKQADCLAQGMKNRPVKKIFCSTLKRALTTAEVLGTIQNAQIFKKRQLIEVEFGEWEGLTWDEIKKNYPKEYCYWSLHPDESAPPGGERQSEILDRCRQVVKDIINETRGREDVAVVSHGATLAHLLTCMLRPNSLEESIIVENASITTVNYQPLTGDFMLLERNDTAHLTGTL